MNKAVIVVHGIGEQERFETLFEFCDGFHRVMRDIVKDFGEGIKKELLEITEEDAKKPYLANAALRVSEECLKSGLKLNIALFAKNVGSRLDYVLRGRPAELRKAKDVFQDREARIFAKARDIEAILTLEYKYKLFPRGLGMERDGFAEIAHGDNRLRLYELWWASDVRKKPSIYRILLWLLRTTFRIRRKALAIVYSFLMAGGLVFIFAAVVIHWIIPPLRKWIKLALVDYFGDVNVYLADKDGREKIKDKLREKIHWLHANDAIEEIHIIGHSLGSVIAFDVLRGLGPDAAAKVKHFYSVGSPLDKIRYLWGEDYGDEVVDALQGKGIKWYNYYAALDIVGSGLKGFGRLAADERFYNSLSMLAAHTAYWQNRAVMENIIRDIYAGDIVFQETDKARMERKKRNRAILRRRGILLFPAFLVWSIAALGIALFCVVSPVIIVCRFFR